MKSKKPLLDRKEFLSNLIKSIIFAFVILLFSIGAGVLGYKYFCDLSWVDALLNASMILTGMGPVNPIFSNSGKIFASIYALYSGIAFLTIFAVFFAPIFHRFLHKFHLDIEEKEEG